MCVCVENGCMKTVSVKLLWMQMENLESVLAVLCNLYYLIVRVLIILWLQ